MGKSTVTTNYLPKPPPSIEIYDLKQSYDSGDYAAFQDQLKYIAVGAVRNWIANLSITSSNIDFALPIAHHVMAARASIFELPFSQYIESRETMRLREMTLQRGYGKVAITDFAPDMRLCIAVSEYASWSSLNTLKETMLGLRSWVNYLEDVIATSEVAGTEVPDVSFLNPDSKLAGLFCEGGLYRTTNTPGGTAAAEEANERVNTLKRRNHTAWNSLPLWRRLEMASVCKQPWEFRGPWEPAPTFVLERIRALLAAKEQAERLDLEDFNPVIGRAEEALPAYSSG